MTTFVLRFKNSNWFWVLSGTLLLLWVAIYNGFPIVYPDTSTYLASGFELETPFDRPITYGLFVMLTSIHGISLWLTAAVQSLMLVCILLLLFKHIAGNRNYGLCAFISILVLCVFTSLPWISGMLLADVFTSISIFTLLLLVFINTLSRSEKTMLYIFFVLSNAMHMSHILINVLLLVSLLLLSRFRFLNAYFRDLKVKKLLLLLVISLSGILIMASAMSKSKHIFYMGRMVENGILKQYLDESCATHNYKICAYKDSLPPNADRFLWDFKNSPVYKLGGWKECKDEFNQIIWETLKQPKYLKLHALASVKGTTEQLTAFTIGEGNISFGQETPLYQRVQKYTKNIDQYAHSKQTDGSLANSFWIFDLMNRVAIYGSLLLLIALLAVKQLRKNITRNQVLFIIFSLLGVFYNDFVCASLSTVANRFGARVIWIIPLVLLIIISGKIGKTNQQQ